MKEVLSALKPSLAVASIFINLVFVVLVIVRTSRTLLYMVFLAICLTVIYWNFCTFLAGITGDQSWFYLSLAGSAMLPALMFHFVVILVKPGRRSSTWTAPSYIFSCLLASAGFVALAYPEVRSPRNAAIWTISYLVLLFPLFLTGLVILLRAFRRTGPGSEKSRLLYILLAGLIGVFTAFTDHAWVLKVPVPPLGNFGSVFYSSVLAIGVFKHRAAYDILAQTRMKLEVMNEMVAGISHEIRNPLSSINGACKILIDRIKNIGGTENREYLDIVTEEIDRLDRILESFQSLAYPSKIHKELISLNDVILKTVTLAKNDAVNLQIDLDLSVDLPPVSADAAALKQVFINMIKNAAEACGSDAKLEIRTFCYSSKVKISFSDNGPGIQADLINRIFNPFFSTKPGGMGLGLSISRKIILAHNGQIEAINISPQGMLFTIVLTV